MAQINIKIPNIDVGNLNNANYAKQIANYLASLEESLRYMFSNLDDENMSSKFIKDLTVENINITNGDNSIIGNAEEGFKLLKGNKVVMHLDIISGDASFNGKVESNSGNIGGWNISDTGISNKESEAIIELYDDDKLSAVLKKSGIFFHDRFTGESPLQGGFMVMHGSNGTGGYNSGLCLLQAGDADYLSIGYTSDVDSDVAMIDIALIYTEDGFNASNGYHEPGFHFVRDVRFYSNVYCSSLNNGTPITTANHTHNGFTGTFETGDGKTATVIDGIIKSIV